MNRARFSGLPFSPRRISQFAVLRTFLVTPMTRTFIGSILTATLLLVALVVGCDVASDDPPEEDPPEEDPSGVSGLSLPDGFTADEFAADLELPTKMAFPPDGSERLFVNELQSGRILIIEDGELRDEPFAELETNVDGSFPVDGENGLIGIAFDPDYETNGYVYVTYAYRDPDHEHVIEDGKHDGIDVDAWGAIARFTDNNNRGEDFEVLMDSIPSKPGHQVQNLTFGPDGKLYVSVGDAYDEPAAQDTSTMVGKVLRMNPDGSIPDDNPYQDAYTYAYGLRNAFDLAFNADGELYLTDNGPDKSDELNRIEAGENYGWPNTIGDRDDPDSVDPIHDWGEQTVGPSGLIFYDGDQFPESYRDAMFVVLFGPTAEHGPTDWTKRVQVVTDLDAGSASFEDFAVYEFAGEGNPTDIAQGPDGSLYLSDIFQGTIYRIQYSD